MLGCEPDARSNAPDSSSKVQLLEALRTLFDPETMMDVGGVEKSELLEMFYGEEHCDNFLARIETFARDGAGSFPSALTYEYAVESVLCIVELLCFCVMRHGFRIKYYVVRTSALEKVLMLLRRREGTLKAAAVRFLKSCISARLAARTLGPAGGGAGETLSLFAHGGLFVGGEGANPFRSALGGALGGVGGVVVSGGARYDSDGASNADSHGETYYLKYIVNNALLDSVVDALRRQRHRYNVFTSAVFDLIETARREELKPLVIHIVEKHGAALSEICSEVGMSGTYDRLLTKYEQYMAQGGITQTRRRKREEEQDGPPEDGDGGFVNNL